MPRHPFGNRRDARGSRSLVAHDVDAVFPQVLGKVCLIDRPDDLGDPFNRSRSIDPTWPLSVSTVFGTMVWVCSCMSGWICGTVAKSV